jgi:predicted nucleotidyltransferase
MDDLPADVTRTLDDVITTAKRCSGENLKSVVLFGSAAEGRLRATSDINLILVFGEIRLPELEALRECIGFAHSVIRLNSLFLEEAEVTLAAKAFAVKFSDIRTRHRVLYGADFFADLQIAREAIIARLKQVILNLTLRLRENYVLSGERQDQRVRVIAEASGPVRACAAAILQLEGGAAASPKDALRALTQQLGDRSWDSVLQNLSAVRQQHGLTAQAVEATIAGLLELLRAMYRRVDELQQRLQ